MDPAAADFNHTPASENCHIRKQRYDESSVAIWAERKYEKDDGDLQNGGDRGQCEAIDKVVAMRTTFSVGHHTRKYEQQEDKQG